MIFFVQVVPYIITGPEVYCAQTSEAQAQKAESTQRFNTELNSLSRLLMLELTYSNKIM